MKVEAKLNAARQILQRTGFDKGGAVQAFWTSNVARHLRPYLPFRGANSVRAALERGADLKTGIITVSLPYARYLYYGKVMVGPKAGPKHPIDQDLRYTKTHNPKAGPFWDRRMLAEKKRVLMNDLYAFLGKERY